MSTQDASYWLYRPINDEQRDWTYGEKNWVRDYAASIVHPHRQVIIDELKKFDWYSLVEVGCNCGPNLQLIANEFNHKNLFGIDPNPEAVIVANKNNVPALITAGIAQKIPFEEKSIDVLLCDASLMYIPPNEINQVMDSLSSIARKAIIIIDRFDESDEGVTEGHIWSRNYTKLLKDRGWEVKEINMTEELWPTSQRWIDHGRYFVAQAPSQTSTPS